jgi:hypothetical protein
VGLSDWLRSFRKRGAPQLEPFMEALAMGGGADVRRRFFAALLRSRLILPSPGLAATGLPMNTKVRPVEDVTINLIATEAPDGSQGLVAFTSELALRAWRPVGCPYVELVGSEVIRMALHSELKSIVINPRGPTGGYVSHAELLALAEGSDAAAPSTVRNLPPGSIQLHPLRAPPSRELADLVMTTAAGLPQIRAVWILDATIGNAPPHRMVVVEHAVGVDPQSFVPALMERLQTVLGNGEYLDCLPVPSGHGLVGAARATARPLFSRGG